MIGWGMDRLRAFEVFVTVVGQGSFTHAADKLETSPANVTRYVNQLEESLGAAAQPHLPAPVADRDRQDALRSGALHSRGCGGGRGDRVVRGPAAARTVAGERAALVRHSASGAALAALHDALSGHRTGAQPDRSRRRSCRGRL